MGLAPGPPNGPETRRDNLGSGAGTCSTHSSKRESSDGQSPEQPRSKQTQLKKGGWTGRLDSGFLTMQWHWKRSPRTEDHPPAPADSCLRSRLLCLLSLISSHRGLGGSWARWGAQSPVCPPPRPRPHLRSGGGGGERPGRSLCARQPLRHNPGRGHTGRDQAALWLPAPGCLSAPLQRGNPRSSVSFTALVWKRRKLTPRQTTIYKKHIHRENNLPSGHTLPN